MAKKKGLDVSGGVVKPGCSTAKPKTAAQPKAEKKDTSVKKAKGVKPDGSAKVPHAKSAYQCFCAAERGAAMITVEALNAIACAAS